jgi:hypothetical protein
MQDRKAIYEWNDTQIHLEFFDHKHARYESIQWPREVSEIRLLSYRSVLASATTVEGTVRKRSCYSVVNFTNAVRKVVQDKWSVYKAVKECGVPWSTMNDHVSRHMAENIGMEKVMPADIPKLGRPFVLPKLVELRLVKYIIEMQELGFGLNVTQIKQLAFQLSKHCFHKISI